MSENKCPECGSAKIMRDNERGELVCQSCGLVVSDEMVDMSKRWKRGHAQEVP